jgi:hypothetical protein
MSDTVAIVGIIAAVVGMALALNRRVRAKGRFGDGEIDLELDGPNDLELDGPNDLELDGPNDDKPESS